MTTKWLIILCVFQIQNAVFSRNRVSIMMMKSFSVFVLTGCECCYCRCSTYREKSKKNCQVLWWSSSSQLPLEWTSKNSWRVKNMLWGVVSKKSDKTSFFCVSIRWQNLNMCVNLYCDVPISNCTEDAWRDLRYKTHPKSKSERW